MSVELIGPYHSNCDGGGGSHTKAIGWDNLKVGQTIHGKPAPYRIDRNGTTIGWAPASSVRFNSERKGISIREVLEIKRNFAFANK